MRKTIAKLWFQPYTPIIFFLILLLVLSKFAYPTLQKIVNNNNEIQTISITPAAGVLGDETSIINAVSKLMRLSADENPQIITITNIDQFKDQPFFKDAKNGDILLLYSKSKKAILYDPQQNRIIDTAPIVASSSAEASPSSNRLQQ